MKKIMFGLLIITMFLTGCTAFKSKNITVTATIESVHENSLVVTVSPPADFDKASVGISKKTKIIGQDGKSISLSDLSQGDTIELTVLPEMRESYPVQVDAVKIVLVESENDMTSQKASYQKITVEKAKEMMKDEAVIILDVRTEEEHDQIRIPNSILLPVDEIQARALEVLPDKNATVLVYCRSGNRSATASKELIAMGYANIYDFGGIIDWTGETDSGA